MQKMHKTEEQQQYGIARLVAFSDGVFGFAITLLIINVISAFPSLPSSASDEQAEFIQLEVRKPQMTKGALMEELSVPACTREPCGDGGLTVALRPVRRRMHPVLRLALTTPLRSDAREFSNGTRACRVGQ